MNNIRIGHGYDVHRLVENRKLILGGVEIEHHLGLEGHSDADVLTHAIMDALLGAAGLNDIGYYFPPSDDRYKNADSLQLLTEVLRIIKGDCATLGDGVTSSDSVTSINNIDCVIITEEPKLRPHIESIRIKLSSVMKLPIESVNVKATTNEKIGFIGRGEGIAASAVCLLVKND